jgi:hypothetical protein
VIFTNKREPRSHQELSELEREQLVVAGKLYDGCQLPVEARLDVNAPAEFDDPNFSGYFEIWDVLNEGVLAYTAMLYKVDSGTMFKANTTENVAEIIQGYLECADDTLYNAIAEAVERAREGNEDYPRFRYQC